MDDNFLGEIRLFAHNTIPTGWVPCNGQLMPMTGNTALFSLISNTFGGDGKTNFALPNLQGRVLINGNGTSVSPFDPDQPHYTLGQQGGSETVTLDTTTIPMHNHDFTAGESYDVLQPNTNYLGNTATPSVSTQANKNTGTANLYNNTNTALQNITQLNSASVSTEGGSGPHTNMQPFNTLVYCIATQGVYPPRP